MKGKFSLDSYRVFMEVYECSSFTEAAGRLYVTQSAVSQSIRQLEMMLGVELFVRSGRAVKPTMEAKELYAMIFPALQTIGEAEDKLEQLKQFREGSLRIGAADTVARRFLLPYLQRWHDQYPGVRLEVTNRTSTEAFRLLAAGKIDMAFVNSPVMDDKLSRKCCLELHDVFIAGERFAHLKGKKLLGLASGGGQQMPIFSKLGAECTVFDNSKAQLEAERMVAAREGYDIAILQGDMTKPLPFPNESFDLIFHPVSNCYVEDVRPIWRECYRILKKGGALLAGFDNGINFLFEDDSLQVVNRLPFNPLKMPKERFERMANNYEAIQFSHSLEEQIGGQLEAGFTLLSLYEDRDRPGGPAISQYAPQYIATYARK